MLRSARIVLLVVLVVSALALVAAHAVWRGASSTIDREITRGAEVPDVDAGAVASLPPVVARYLARSIPRGQKPIRWARLEQQGQFLVNDAWLPLQAAQVFTASPPQFMWDARIRMFPLVSVYVRDAYLAGHGSMRARVAAIYPVVNQSRTGALDTGALMRYLGEAVWFPTRLQPGGGLTWTAIDDHHALATLVDRDTSVSLRFTFDDDGDIAELYAPNRPREVNGQYVPTPWRVNALGQVDLEGFRMMSPAEAEWVMPEGPRPYWRGRVSGIDYGY